MAEPARSSEVRLRILLGLSLVSLAVLAELDWWPGGRAAQPRSAAIAEPWMADALPGVGRKRLAGALDAIKSGELAALPAAARPLAQQWFSPPPQ